VADLVVQRFELGFQWPTIDPFLFCVHHDDAYPPANDSFGPDASLAERELGQDFEGIDGWRMYHGHNVPGFPPHPHRGFETVTYVRQGLVDHADSLGAQARFGRGDVQWLTAGSGIVHSEMFPLLDPDDDNPLELFQIWLNLPAEDKLADPYFAILWDADIPRRVVTGADGTRAEITVIAGALDHLVPPSPPPSSWASHPDAEVAIWHLHLDGGASLTLPPCRGDATVRTLYAFEGGDVHIGDEPLGAGNGAVVRSDVELEVSADEPAEVLVLQGRPIGQPVAQHGPFVMNDDAGIEQAIADYRATGFGGWPWRSEEPVHGRNPSRFARRPDGALEDAP
jgi:quercetin 2,3-dioxygenase